MNILITGNMGYVGPAVARRLRLERPDAVLHGYDSGFFAHCLTGAAAIPERWVDHQHFGDIRDIGPELLDGVDAVVHLAAVSNDPMGNRFAEVTDDVNHQASVRLARLCRQAGVGSFVFASSCSVYGVAAGPPRREDDELNPMTPYARSKIATERDLQSLAGDAFTVTCLRFATACGMSDRLRLDLVLNDFVAGAMASGEITVLSDGTPWRPLIDVADMALAIDWALQRDRASEAFVALNVGSNDRNYQVRQLAEAVAKAIPGTAVSINTAAPADSRSYRVDFSLYGRMAPDHQPQVTLARSIEQLRTGLEAMGFADPDFRNSPLVRLRVLQTHMDEGRLAPDLRWIRA